MVLLVLLQGVLVLPHSLLVLPLKLAHLLSAQVDTLGLARGYSEDAGSYAATDTRPWRLLRRRRMPFVGQRAVGCASRCSLSRLRDNEVQIVLHRKVNLTRVSQEPAGEHGRA